MTHAGALAVTGPAGQEANIALLDDGLLVVVCTGISPAAAVTWSEGRVGLLLFLEAVLSRQSPGQTPEAAGLDVAGWASLERLAGQRAHLLASRRVSAETRALATRYAPTQHGTKLPPPAGTHREACSSEHPGRKTWPAPRRGDGAMRAMGGMKGGGGSGLEPDAKEAPSPLAHPPE